MKRILFLAALLLSVATIVNAQDFDRISKLDIKTKDEAKAAEGDALQAANYLLSTPFSESAERKASVRLVVMWTTATSYKFLFDQTAMDLFNKNEDILGLIMASMTKTVLENPGIDTEGADMKMKSYKTLLDYCGEPSNNIKLTKELKKAVAANKEGKLKEYLKL